MRRSGLFLFLSCLFALSNAPASRAQSDPFVGQVMIVPYNFAPRGWNMCDGSLVAISQNTALFSLLGTQFGGDGRVTFALPDLRGRAPIGMGQGPGLSNYSVGESGGLEQVTLSLAQIPNHSHLPVGSTAVPNTGSPTNAYWAMPRILLYSSAPPSVEMSSGALGTTGGGQPVSLLKPYLVLNYVIAMQGIFPARN
jgi:microcystin-dependent protein